MDEAESLCDNIVIMVNGRFVCYGSPSHLKATYGEGYNIDITHTTTESEILAEMKVAFPYFDNGLFKMDHCAEKEKDNEGEETTRVSTFKIAKMSDMLHTIGGLNSVFG